MSKKLLTDKRLRHSSDNKTQREIEKYILKKRKLNSGKSTPLKGSARVNIDGKDRKGYYEIYARTGRLRPAQFHKIMNDAVKLFLAARYNKKRNKIIIFTDEMAERPFTESSWRAIVLRELGVKTKVFELPKVLIKKLSSANENFNKIKVCETLQDAKIKIL
ncbi:MAG: hypothetical protein NUV53_02330 [Patescibacteria group bacterium]|nr:hypothetical protein [Patescibacteria group bacterium]